MKKLSIAAVLLATTALAGCGNPAPRSDLAYLDRGTGTDVIDRSPYNGQFCHCAPTLKPCSRSQARSGVSRRSGLL